MFSKSSVADFVFVWKGWGIKNQLIQGQFYNIISDVDECAIGQSTCDYQCVNTLGSFVCTCFDGQSGSLNNCTGNIYVFIT